MGKVAGCPGSLGGLPTFELIPLRRDLGKVGPAPPGPSASQPGTGVQKCLGASELAKAVHGRSWLFVAALSRVSHN